MSLYPPDVEDDLAYEPVRGRARVLLTSALWPLFVGYAGVVSVLALVIATATRAHLTTAGVLTAAMPGWLATYQVPLTLGGHGFGALPLLPTLAMMLLIARVAGNAADRLAVVAVRETVPILVAITATHATAGLVLAEVTSNASGLAGFFVPAVVSGVAATLGLAARGCFHDLLGRFDDLVTRGLRAGLLGLVALLGAGALLVAFGLVTSWTTTERMFDLPGIGDGVGMFLLSTAYLPNAVVAGTSFAVGPGVSIGHLSATPLHFTNGPLPRVPLLAAFPESGAAWWPVVFLLPLGVGALVGWVLRDACEDPIARLRAVGGAAAVVALGCAGLGIAAGGRLAEGPFTPLSVHPWSLGIAVLLWIALPAATVAWWTGPRLVLAPSRSLLDDAIEAEAAAGDEADEDEDVQTQPAAEAEEPGEDPEPDEDQEPEAKAGDDEPEEPAQDGPDAEDPELNT
ncbi:DUF6350 family protein [Actinocrispum sp. NPDC049592]|uniref:cell division protein PerM n=1 Tax=Actinocrispum sp. NPDC049592 TaxID=3154835 RepID=UPI00343DEBCE